MQIEAALQKIWDTLVAVFMAPGNAMMESLAGTSWGAEWGIPGDEWTINAVVALLFWCVVISLIGAMDDQIRRVSGRTTRREGRRNRRRGDVR